MTATATAMTTTAMTVRIAKFGVIAVAALSLCGCANMTRQQQRALSGGAIGAAGGAVFSAILGGPILVGTALGAASGAAVGALTK